MLVEGSESRASLQWEQCCARCWRCLPAQPQLWRRLYVRCPQTHSSSRFLVTPEKACLFIHLSWLFPAPVLWGHFLPLTGLMAFYTEQKKTNTYWHAAIKDPFLCTSYNAITSWILLFPPPKKYRVPTMQIHPLVSIWLLASAFIFRKIWSIDGEMKQCNTSLGQFLTLGKYAKKIAWRSARIPSHRTQGPLL